MSSALQIRGGGEGEARPDPWQLQRRCGEKDRVSHSRREAGLPSTPGPARLWVELWAKSAVTE